MKLKTENIYQVVALPAAPAKVFDALIDQDEHGAFTGKEAFIQPHEGGSVSICNGNQTGWITRLVRNKRIVLALQNSNSIISAFQKTVPDGRPSLGRRFTGNRSLHIWKQSGLHLNRRKAETTAGP
jgi:hypothetical protein